MNRYIPRTQYLVPRYGQLDPLAPNELAAVEADLLEAALPSLLIVAGTVLTLFGRMTDRSGVTFMGDIAASVGFAIPAFRVLSDLSTVRRQQAGIAAQ